MQSTEPSYPSAMKANYMLSILTLIYVSNQWSRYIFNYLYAVSDDDDYVSISTACDLSTSEYGILIGYGFVATFCVTGIVMGKAADNYSRKNIVAVGCTIWNLALGGMGMSNSFSELLVARLALGFGQAFSNPASYSTIKDLFAPAEQARANGIFTAGLYLGGGLASVSESLTEKSGADLGWRNMMYICALCGLALSGILWTTTSEPARTSAASKKAAGDDEKTTSTLQSLQTIFSSTKTNILLLSAGIRFMGGYAIAGYLPYMYSYVFSDYTTEYSDINAFVVAGCGFASSALGGMLCSQWKERQWLGYEKANYYVPVIACVAGCPFMAICCLSGNFYVSLIVGLGFEYLVAESWFGAYMTALMETVPGDCSALVVSVSIFIGNFMGATMSYALGVVYDDAGCTKCIRYMVLVAVCGTYLTSAVLFYTAAQMTSSHETPPKQEPTEVTGLLKQDEEEA